MPRQSCPERDAIASSCYAFVRADNAECAFDLGCLVIVWTDNAASVYHLSCCVPERVDKLVSVKASAATSLCAPIKLQCSWELPEQLTLSAMTLGFGVVQLVVWKCMAACSIERRAVSHRVVDSIRR